MEFKDKKIFISGGAGVIGSALVEKLSQAGAKLFIGDLKPRPAKWPQDILYRQGDLNYIRPQEILSFEPDIFFHLAATFERSVETYDFWHENYHHNLRLSNHIMSCLKESETLKRVVFASSYLIYNPNQYYFDKPAEKALRLKETDPIYPRNLCGTAKLMHEMELKFLEHFNNDLKTISARIFRVYGKNSRDVISRWIRSLLKGEPITLYKPEGLFDYIYADEVAEGLMHLCLTNETGIVNLGNDNARRVTEVIKILRLYFPEMEIIQSDMDISYEASQANMDSFKRITGWKPSKQLEDAIPEIIDFEKNIGYKDGTDTNINILITSVSQKVPLVHSLKNACEKLGNKGTIIGADINPNCIAKYFTDDFWEMPSLADLKEEDLLNYCKDNNIKVIIPTRDGELSYFAKLRNTFKQRGIVVMIPEPEVVEMCLDKLKFYQILEKLGFPVIQTSDRIEEIKSERFVVKERFGAGSRTIGLNLSKDEALIHAQKLTDPIYQPFIKGREMSVDLYADQNKKVKGVVVRSRELVVDGESQITKIERNEEVEELMIRLAEKVGFYGHIVLQVIIGENNDSNIVECNTRFGGASSLSVEYGLDSFYWFLLEALENNTEQYHFIRPDKELKQIRYKADFIL